MTSPRPITLSEAVRSLDPEQRRRLTTKLGISAPQLDLIADGDDRVAPWIRKAVAERLGAK